MKECPNCKAKVDQNSKFCTNCGTSLNEVEKKEEVKVEATAQSTNNAPKGEGLGTASMILGIISLVLSFVTWLVFPIILLVLTILVGLILGIVNLAQGGKKFAGLILNGISIVTGVASFVIVYVFVFTFLGLELFNYIDDYTTTSRPYTTRTVTTTTTTKANDPYAVANKYYCGDSKVSSSNYSSVLTLNSDKSFTWNYTDDTFKIEGSYTSSIVDKKTSLPNTQYYKIVMTSNKVEQNGKEIEGSKGKKNTYEMGIDSSKKTKEIVMINENTYSMYYCIEAI